MESLLDPFTFSFKMLSSRLAFLFVALAALANTVFAIERVVVKRDDNLPARVPYIFPPPGTDAVRSDGSGWSTVCASVHGSLQVADSIRARRVNGTLLDLDGVL